MNLETRIFIKGIFYILLGLFGYLIATMWPTFIISFIVFSLGAHYVEKGTKA